MLERPSETTVDTPAGLQEFCRQVRSEGIVAFDTEFIGENTYIPRLCLVQAATRTVEAIIDPLAVDITPFWHLVIDPAIEVVVNAGKEDFAICRHHVGKPPTTVTDVQVAAGFVGIQYPLSYRKLVHNLLGVELHLNQKYTDWSRRPLRDVQRQYAFEDVCYLLRIHDMLVARLEQEHRLPWLREEMLVYEDDSRYGPQVETAYQKVRGHAYRNPRQLAVLKEIAAWRELEAYQRDVPRRFIPDGCLLDICRRPPKTLDDLRDIFREGGGRDQDVDKAGDEILAVVKRGLEAPPEGLPPARNDAPPAPPELLEAVTAAGKALCEERKISEPLLASKRDYNEFVRYILNPHNGAGPRLAMGWRNEFAGGALREALRAHGVG